MNIYSDIRIIPVKTRNEINSFINFPYTLYRDEKNWVPPLRITQKSLFNAEHIFWKKNKNQFFLAMKNGSCAGRIVAFVNNQHNIHFNTTDGFFGFLEAHDDPAIFDALLDAAIDFLKQNKCNKIIGPMNPDIHNELGTLVQGFETPGYIMLTYNFNYYDLSIQQCGFNKLRDFYSYKMNEPQYHSSPKMERVQKQLLDKYAIRLRTPDMKNFKQELEYFNAIYNDAFRDHWGFVPISKDEFFSLAKDMKSIIDPRMVLIAEYKDDPIAFLLSLPNINEILVTIRNGRLLPTGIFKLLWGKKNIGSIRVITAAVKKKYERLGIGALLYPELMRRALQFGYTTGELSWIVEDNVQMNSIAKQLAGAPYKTYRIYSKQIT
ncbi:hypothetical protein BH10BAC3_BH10BAC3_14060 [soil metagenome]